MSVDIIARAMAMAARSSSGSGGAASAPIGRFTDLPTKTIDPASSALVTSGYTTAGKGQGVYAADSLATAALAAAHPRFCKADAAGRYFRLVTDEINVAQGGALGTGNDQPAIQAAVAYAAAVGIRAVRLLPFHESWHPTRPGGSPDPLLGHHLVVTGNVALLGADSGTIITLKGQGGAGRTAADGNNTWWCGWLIYMGAAVTSSILRDITVDGAITFANVRSTTESNIWDKGVVLADWAAPNLVRIDHRNVTLTRFAGEIWYMGGTMSGCTAFVENLTVTKSPQACWNPGTLAKVVAVNLVAGDSYQPAETISGMGHTYIGGRFFGGGTSTFITTEAFDSNYYYNYPFFTQADPRYTTFVDTVFDKVATFMCSRTRGRIQVIDGGIQFLSTGKLCDIDLEVEAWCDASNAANVVTIPGVATLTTQVPAAPAGVYYETPRDLHVKVICRRTARSHATGRWRAGIALSSGPLFDQASCLFEVVNGGDAANGPVDLQFAASNTQWPLFMWDDSFKYGLIENYVSPAADFTADAPVSHMIVDPQAPGTFTMTLANSHGYSWAEGQRLRINYLNGGGGRYVRMPATGYGYALKETRVLGQTGDYVDLAWNSFTSTWVEAGYRIRNAVRQGSVSYNPPSIAAGAQATTTVTVTGANVGDRAELTFSQSLGGLLLTGYVSAADTVTAVFANLTGGAVDLASGTLGATVRPT